MDRVALHTLHPVSARVSTLYNHSARAKPGNTLVPSTELLQVSLVSQALVCVCVALCSFMCVDLHVCHHSQDTDLFHGTDPPCFPFILTATSLLPSTPNLCQLLIFPSSLQFCHFSNAIYCRNHAVWTFEVDFLHSARFPWDPFKLLCASTVCSSALLSSSPWCECISFFHYLPIEGCFDCFWFFGYYTQSFYEHPCTGFLRIDKNPSLE